MNWEQAIRELYYSLKDHMRQKWDRVLPLDELLFDRWEKAEYLHFGKGSSIYHNSYVYGKPKVGKYVWVGPFVILDAGGGLTIGDYVSISSGVHIYTHDSVKWALSGGVEPYESGAVDIGDCCHIGANSVVARGVKIGHHSVVGAASFVRANVEPYSIVSGVPAQMIGTVTIVNGRVQYAFK